MNTHPRCDWSDLPTTDCNHCHPEPRPAEPTTRSAERERLRAEAAAALAQHPMRVVYPVAHQTPTGNEAPTARALDIDRESFRDADLHDIVVALVEPTRHRQPYTIRNADGVFVTQRWETSSPALLDQLGSAVEQSRSSEGGDRAVFGSKPSARLDAIDALARITREVEVWIRRLQLEMPYLPGPHGTSVVDVHTAIRRAAANVTAKTPDEKALRRDVRSWWILARITTGWDSPAWRPRNSCPICGVSKGLRIRLDVQIGVCTECDAEWDAATIGLLADHIRGENGDGSTGAVVEEVGA